jgi:D-3-phosphoglycerate dehydrogenase
MNAVASVLIADPIHASGRQILDGDDRFRVDIETELDEKALMERIGDYDALIVRSKTKVTKPVIEAATRLRAIGRAGIGVDNIDIPSATQRGIVVFNTPDSNATTTAELAIAHLMSLSRNLPRADRAVRAGDWKPSRYSGVELSGKTIGVIGFGTIGRLVAERCVALKMRVIAHDPFVAPEIMAEHGADGADLEKLLAEVDYVTLHCPLSEKTRHLLDGPRLSTMKLGARVINCARGGLVDETALFEALQSGHLAGAALDVFETEPPSGSPLLELNNVVLTPHLGASTEEAQKAVSLRIAEDMINFLTTGAAETAVNLPRVSSDQLSQTVPYQKLAFALGRLVGSLCEGPISRLDVRLFGRVVELDSRPVTAEALVGVLSQRMTGRVNRVNAGHLAKSQGIELTESKTEEARDFLSLLEISAECCGKTSTVAGTLLGGSRARLVRIDGYDVEAVPEGAFLFTRHQDEPGVVGALGSILGREKINISRMQVGIGEDPTMAIALISISAPLPEAAMEEIRSLEPIKQVVSFEL